MDLIFHALAHQTRREMLNHLTTGEQTIGELAAPFSMSLEAASKHVRVLERAGLVHRAVLGRRHVCRLQPQALGEAWSWLGFYRQFWSEQLDRLDAMFQDRHAPIRDTEDP